MAAMPCHTWFLTVFPTADLAGRSGCDTLRADLQRHTRPCGFCMPAFSLPRAGLSHFHQIPITSLHEFSNLDLNQKGTVFKTVAQPLSISFLRCERDLWLPNLLGQPMPLATCLSLAGYSAGFQDNVALEPQCSATSDPAQRPFLRIGLLHYLLPSWLADWFDRSSAPPVSLQAPRLPLARPVRTCFFRSSASPIEPPLWFSDSPLLAGEACLIWPHRELVVKRCRHRLFVPGRPGVSRSSADCRATILEDDLHRQILVDQEGFEPSRGEHDSWVTARWVIQFPHRSKLVVADRRGFDPLCSP